MSMSRISTRTLAVLTLWAGLSGSAAAQPRAEEILARKPVQGGVAISTPTGAEAAGCRAEPVTWPKQANGPTPTGITVKDAQGRILRQFIDTNGRNQPNIFSFYLNGTEAYREIDANGNGKPDQYRWLGANGTRWGADSDEDGTVDTWYVISPEELSQELFTALQSKDMRRLKALLASEQELKSLGLPDNEVAKAMQKVAGAMKKVEETAATLALTDKAKWIHLESSAPQATPADSFGGREDLLRHRSTTVLFDRGDGKSADVFQTGELVLIGRAWKMIEGPTPGATVPVAPGEAPAGVLEIPEAVRDLISQIGKLTPPSSAGEMSKYHAERAALLEQVVAKLQGAQQEPWLRQVIDAYASAAEGSGAESPAMQRLKQWKSQIEQAAPKSAAASYAAFRVLSAEYTQRLADPKADYPKVQTWWKEQLEAFLGQHAASEEAPEAMNRLAQSLEFSGKDSEAKAKEWYEKLASSFPNHPYAEKAQGAIRRLTSEGQPLQLPSGQTIDGRSFSPAQLAGKVVVVYYWANWGRDAVADLKQLAELAKTYGSKGLEIVTISLDEEAAKAVETINAAQLPGLHLHQPGGLDRSPLAVAYGIQMVPHILVVGKDGKIANRNAQAGVTLKDEIEKLTK